MCIACEKRCKCGCQSAAFHFRDNIMSQEVIKELYCPFCSSDITVDPDSMIVDNGWVIEYDMERIDFYKNKIAAATLTPGVVFDEGYCTWHGMYPGDHHESVREREEIAALAKKDPLLYLKTIRSWTTERITRLQREGWRKAMNGSVE